MTRSSIKLGIACVYFYGADGRWLLDLQLNYIASTLAGYDYTVYAGANRLQPELRALLQNTPRVKIIDLPTFSGEGGREHAFYLDKLLSRAVSDGCTYVTTLDSDSFPILPDWPQYLLQQMGSTIRLAAVLRTENLDTFLPHPCGYFMHRSFLLDRQPMLMPAENELKSERFKEFLDATHQRVDNGIGYAYSLWCHAEKWLPLHRSNFYNPHFLMAGIYGGIFFHLGAGSRQPSFHVDYATRPSLRLAINLRRLPFIWRAGTHLENRYLEYNGKIYKQITNALKSDAPKFFAQLTLGLAPKIDTA